MVPMVTYGLPLPTRYCLVAGSGEGYSCLNAFDTALLAAGIGNMNLLKVSSILPAGARQVSEISLPPGSLVPTAYAALTSDVPGEVISAAVAVGHGSRAEHGVIMELSGRRPAREIEAEIRRMVEDAFARRGRKLVEVQVKSIEHVVRRTGCAFAAVALLYDEVLYDRHHTPACSAGLRSDQDQAAGDEQGAAELNPV